MADSLEQVTRIAAQQKRKDLHHDTGRESRQLIDARLEQSGWVIQDLSHVNPIALLGVAVREYPTSTGPVDYGLCSLRR